MSGRTTLRGNGMPGGRIEYPGDLPAFSTSRVNPMRRSSIGQRLAVPGSTVSTRSAVVDRHNRRGGIISFYGYGAVPMRLPIPSNPAYGSVVRSPFQRFNVTLVDYQINPSWHEAGYPQNLRYSFRAHVPQTKATGGPGNSQMQQRPLFTRVQTVGRTRATVTAYQTRGART